MIDEFTRECLGIRVEERITSEGVTEALGKIFREYGIPEYVRSDNGPEFISESLRTWLLEREIRPLSIEPGSPWENGFVESFNGKFRDECLNAELFWGREEAQAIVNAWRREDNSFRPHSALDYRTPSELALSLVEAASESDDEPRGETENRGID